MIFQKFSKFVDKICCLLGKICGDQCLFQERCKCGNRQFNDADDFYCCIPSNETCKVIPEGM